MALQPDERIKQEVLKELAWDYRVDASNITVEAEDGAITLKGSVPSYTERVFATSDAWSIANVIAVTNLLTVEFPTALPLPSDAEVQSNVQSVLAWNSAINSVNIDVAVENGIVTLEGSVENYWQKWRAEELVANLSGVIGVDNHLSVVPTRSFVDQDIAEDIESALDRNLYVDAEDVTVKVKDGAVTLTGTLPTYYARRKAYDAAANTLGVIEVNNQVAVA